MFPVVRIPLPGGQLFLGMGASNRLKQTYQDFLPMA